MSDGTEKPGTSACTVRARQLFMATVTSEAGNRGFSAAAGLMGLTQE